MRRCICAGSSKPLDTSRSILLQLHRKRQFQQITCFTPGPDGLQFENIRKQTSGSGDRETINIAEVEGPLPSTFYF
jgi:hypothetical protein